MQIYEQTGPKTENIVKLASVGINLPEIYVGHPPGIHAVHSAKKIDGSQLPRLEDAKL
jgi:hypothetical protein